MIHTRIKSIISLLLLLTILVFPVGAQGAQESGTTQRIETTAVDALGRTVSIEGPVQRVMIVGRAAVMPADALFLFPAVTDMEVVLAKTDQGLGDFFNLIRPEFAQAGRLGQQVSAEEIIAHNPDLVLTKTSNYDAVVSLVEPFGIPVFVMDLETPEAWNREIVQLGKLLGDTDTPQRVITVFEERKQEVVDKIAPLAEEEKPQVLMMQAASADGITAFSVSPETWIQGSLTAMAGGIPVWNESTIDANSWRKISFEQIAAWDPERILLISYRMHPKPFLDQIEQSSQWQQLRAVQQGKVQATPADMMNYFQSDSRWILALQWLAAELHPELFPDFSMEEAITSFYEELYGITDEQILNTLIERYHNSLGH
jgi:iron complex transport system substrate-binding protein